jgi:mono/diheme cytochrome c family protein
LARHKTTMKNFILGFIVALLFVGCGMYVYAEKGYLSFDADQKPSDFEEHAAMKAVDAATDRRAPDVKNPLPANEETIVAGTKLYLNHCAGCHGVPSNPESQFAKSCYPEVPSFFKDAPDMPENQNFYIIQHGVRWTGMPAWNKTLSDTEIWQIVTFMSNIEKLPPAATKELAPYSAPAADGKADNDKAPEPAKSK